jgi:DNA repair exonuclease SbcCD ATPase subunit
VEELQQIVKAIGDIRGSLEILADEASKSESELSRINGEIQDANILLNAVKGQTTEATSMHEETLSSLKRETKDAKEKLVLVREGVVQANIKLAAAKKKHAQFVAYEVRAKKALQAREDSLLRREESLEATISQARRRTGILSGVS